MAGKQNKLCSQDLSEVLKVFMWDPIAQSTVYAGNS